MPAIPSKEPAAGMSATSGPLGDEPDFGGEEIPPAPVPTPAAPSASSPPVATSNANAPDASVPVAAQTVPAEK